MSGDIAWRAASLVFVLRSQVTMNIENSFNLHLQIRGCSLRMLLVPSTSLKLM
jgi:hypothetical protein